MRVAPLADFLASLRRSEDDLYFCSCGDKWIKIGRSKDSTGRVNSFRGANAEPVEIIAVIPGAGHLEKAMHLLFSDLHVRGEWFLFSLEIVALAEAMAANRAFMAAPSGSWRSLSSATDAPDGLVER